MEVTSGQIKQDGTTVRLFVAIELPDGVVSALAGIQEQLRLANIPLRLARPGGIHLTLAFLGDTPPARLPELRAAMVRATTGISIFTLRAAGLGMFPNARRPRVVWVGVEGEAEERSRLDALHGQVVHELQGAGFPSDPRFEPHLTLARVPDRTTASAASQIGATVRALPRPAPMPFDVAHVSLMLSTLDGAGAIYTRLDIAPLAQSRARL